MFANQPKQITQRMARRRRPLLRIPRMIFGSAATVADRSPPPSCSSTIAPGLMCVRVTRCLVIAKPVLLCA
jgi:hypothetical protein